MQQAKHNPGHQDGADYFLLAHLSDPHLSSLNSVKPGDLLNKRLLGYLSWRRRRRHEHRGEVLEALLEDMRIQSPDHIAITGDMTHLGLPEEFQEVRHWLQLLGDPGRVSLVPGNHDAYVAVPWRHSFALWEEYMCADSPSENAADYPCFPSLRIRGPLALIGVSSARPMRPLLATGAVGASQLHWLDRLLAIAGTKGLYRVLLIHHPPLPHSIAWRKRLTDSAALCTIIRRHGVEMVLHGHAHESSQAHLDTPSGAIPVLGVPSASALGLKAGRRAQYHLLRFPRGIRAGSVELEVRGYDPQQHCFVSRQRQRLQLPHQGVSSASPAQ